MSWKEELEEKLNKAVPHLLEIEYTDGRVERLEPMYSQLINFIKQFVSEIRKKDEEELIKRLPAVRCLCKKCVVVEGSYNLGNNQCLAEVVEIIKDYYKE